MIRTAIAVARDLARRALRLWHLRNVDHDLAEMSRLDDGMFLVRCRRGCTARVRVRQPPHRFDPASGTFSRFEVYEGSCPWVASNDHGNEDDWMLS